MEREESYSQVSLTEAQEAVVILTRFFEQQGDADFDLLVQLDNAVEKYALQDMRQTLITDYF